MNIDEVICKFITEISKKELIDISLAEPQVHLMPLVIDIDPEMMKNLESDKTGYEKVVYMVETFLSNNALPGGLDCDLTQLSNSESSHIKSLVLQLTAILSIFTPEKYEEILEKLEEEEASLLKEKIKELSEPLKDTMAKMYTKVSVDEKVYISDLINKVKDYENLLGDMALINEDLKNDIRKEEAKRVDLNAIIKEKDEEINALRTIKNATLQDNELITVQRENMEDNVNKLKDENEALQKRLAKMDVEYSKLNNMVAEYKETVNNYKAKFETFRSREKIFDDALNKLSLYEDKVHNYDKLFNDNQDFKNFITLQNARNKKLQEQVATEIDKIMELRIEVKKLEKENNKYKADTNLLENQNKTLKNEITIYKNNNRNQLINNYLEENQPEKTKEDYINEVGDLRSELNRMRNKYNSNDIRVKEQETEELLFELDKMNNQYNELKETNRKMEDYIEEIKNQNTELRDGNTKFKMDTIDKKMELLETEKNEIIEDLQNKIKAKESMVEDLNNTNNMLNKMLSDTGNNEENFKQLTELLKEKSKELEDMRNTLNTRMSMKNRNKSVDVSSQVNIPNLKQREDDLRIAKLEQQNKELQNNNLRSSKKLSKVLDIRESIPYKKLEELYNEAKESKSTLNTKMGMLKMRMDHAEEKARNFELLEKRLKIKEEEQEKTKKILGETMVELERLRHIEENLNKNLKGLHETVKIQNSELEIAKSQIKQPKESFKNTFKPKKLTLESNMSLFNNFNSRVVEEEKKEDNQFALESKRDDFSRYEDYGLLYSVCMDYLRNHIDVENERRERNKKVRNQLTSAFSMGKLLL